MLELHHRLTGPDDAPVVVLVGSLGSTLSMWDPQVAALSGDRRCLAVDIPGHGLSPVPSSPPRTDEVAEAVVRLVDVLGIDRFSLLGLSYGGAVAQTLAAIHPDRVVALVLACTALRFDDASDFWRARAASVRARGLGDVVRASAERWFTPEHARRDPDVHERMITMLGATPPEGYAACCETLAGFDGRAGAAHVQAPTLVLAAEHDLATPVSGAEAIAAAVPGARLEVLPAAAHLANVEQPALFTASVVAHLEGVGG